MKYTCWLIYFPPISFTPFALFSLATVMNNEQRHKSQAATLLLLHLNISRLRYSHVREIVLCSVCVLCTVLCLICHLARAVFKKMSTQVQASEREREREREREKKCILWFSDKEACNGVLIIVALLVPQEGKGWRRWTKHRPKKRGKIGNF